MLSKGVALAVSAISIPIAIRYLGPENFGVWVTISTALTMLLVLDLGVANSLTNFISEAYARDDRDHASTYTTTALGVVVAVSLLLGGIAWWIWPTLHWDRLFHLSSPSEAPTVSRAVAAALVIFLVGLPAGLAPKILGGYQELRAANLFIAIGSLLNLVSIIVLVRLHAGLVALVTTSDPLKSLPTASLGASLGMLPRPDTCSSCTLACLQRSFRTRRSRLDSQDLPSYHGSHNGHRYRGLGAFCARWPMDHPHLGQSRCRPYGRVPSAHVCLGTDQHLYEQHRHRPRCQGRNTSPGLVLADRRSP